MSFYRWMGKEDVRDKDFNNETLFSHEKEGNPTSADHMDESWGHYCKSNKPDTQDPYCMASVAYGS